MRYDQHRPPFWCISIEAPIFQTVALGYSDFCDIFTQEEWNGFEYWNGAQG